MPKENTPRPDQGATITVLVDPSSDLAGLIAIAERADLDGDEWDMDDIPDASLDLAAACNPRAVIAMATELAALRESDRGLRAAADPSTISRVDAHEVQAESTHPDPTQTLLQAAVLAGFEDWAHVAARARACDAVALELLYRLGDRS